MSLRQSFSLAAGITLWMGCVVAGFCALQRYSAKPGVARAPQTTAAAFLSSHQRPGRSLLVMAIHPLCPCSKASLAELGDLLARSRGDCDALLLQFHPHSGTPEWPVDTTPRQLGGVAVPVILDPDGKIAEALGAETSGHAVLVDAHGEIRFHGGLTVARGHRGRSPAQDAILEILAGRTPSLTTAPVFGSALNSGDSAEGTQ